MIYIVSNPPITNIVTCYKQNMKTGGML